MWDTLQTSALTQCASPSDRSKVKEVFGLFRDRRSDQETCSCIQHATLALSDVLHACQVPNAQWFTDYGQRRLKENQCAGVMEAAAPKPVGTTVVALAAPLAIFAALAGVAGGAVAHRWRAGAKVGSGSALLLGDS
jgi:hypothetical protein